MILWIYNIYQYHPPGATDIATVTSSISYITLSGVDLMLQLSVPAWVGLFAGTAITVRSEQNG